MRPQFIDKYKKKHNYINNTVVSNNKKNTEHLDLQ